MNRIYYTFSVIGKDIFYSPRIANPILTHSHSLTLSLSSYSEYFMMMESGRSMAKILLSPHTSHIRQALL